MGGWADLTLISAGNAAFLTVARRIFRVTFSTAAMMPFVTAMNAKGGRGKFFLKDVSLG